MDEETSPRGILSVHRDSASEEVDPRFADARRKAESDPGLAQWWERDKELDRAIAGKLASVKVPADLKARLLSGPKIPAPFYDRWANAITLAAACLVALGIFYGSWRGPFRPAAALADYRDEMVGFIKVDPTLEMKSPELTQVKDWLEKKRAPSELVVPKKLQGLELIGCRTLRFRGRDVGLICFKRKEGGLLHLFVVHHTALPGVKESGRPQVAAQGDWMTAIWGEGDQVYLMTAQTDRQTLESYLSDA